MESSPCIEHGEYRNSHLVKAQRIIVYGVVSHKLDICTTSIPTDTQKTPRKRGLKDCKIQIKTIKKPCLLDFIGQLDSLTHNICS